MINNQISFLGLQEYGWNMDKILLYFYIYKHMHFEYISSVRFQGNISKQK